MDMQEYASHPSDPLWEEPTWRNEHTIIVNFNCTNHGVSVERHEPRLHSRRREALGEAATKLNSLCASDAPLDEIQDFLAKWEDPLSNGSVQPNALAWFSDTNAVQLACTSENLYILRFLLEKGLRPTIRAADFSRAKWKETKNKGVLRRTLQLLVDYGMDINQPVNHHTPPIMSLLLSDEELVRWCLSVGADPGASSPSGETIMQRAASYASLDVLKLLIKHGGLLRERDLIARASFYRPNDEPGCLEVVRFLLDHGCPIDMFFGGDTIEAENSCMYMVVGRQNALHFAIEQGMRDLVKLLIERGADRNLPAWSATKTKGRSVSPIELARMSGHEEIVSLLGSQDKSVDMP